jgi:hypothetical protein
VMTRLVRSSVLTLVVLLAVESCFRMQ